MKTIYQILFICLMTAPLHAQLYFPPTNSSTWATTDPSTLGWCQPKIDSLYHFLEANSTKAFILLKDGKIVLEKYFNGHSATNNWYWASAGKTLTSTLVGLAQQDNKLNISDLSSKYLGSGWTSCTSAQENKITIRHQLTMTTGLNDALADPYCTTNTCLQYKAEAGTRWAYHNAPYTLLDKVIENATGSTLNQYINQKLKTTIGMDGIFLKQDFNNVYYSTARSMVRFGLLILNKGNWNGTEVIKDQKYYEEMINTSQSINPSYGYLWWLNGKSSFMIPQSQIQFPGSINKSATDDMFSALGKNGQFLNIIPSQNMVWIRMGENPDNALVPFLFNEDIWKYINELECHSSTENTTLNKVLDYQVFPNPAHDILQIFKIENTEFKPITYEVIDIWGNILISKIGDGNSCSIDISSLASGAYLARLSNNHWTETHRFIKI
ncbi:MAG: serine hydrolase [Saprospiraceae bacterium]|nr:serine hydrolase [Saprospiraceae bacterium]